MTIVSDFTAFRLTADQKRFYQIETDWHFGIERRVRWNEVDGFGHVNNSAYMLYFEDTRNTYLECVGLPALHAEKPGPVIARSEEHYLRSLRFEDVIMVTARTTHVGRTSLVMNYGVWQDGLVATGDVVCVLMVNATGEKVLVPDEVRAAIDRYDPQPARASGTAR